MGRVGEVMESPVGQIWPIACRLQEARQVGARKKHVLSGGGGGDVVLDSQRYNLINSQIPWKNCCSDVRFSLNVTFARARWLGWWRWLKALVKQAREGSLLQVYRKKTKFFLLNKVLMEIFSLSRSATAVSNCAGAELQDDFRLAVIHWWGTICKTPVNFNFNEHADGFYC